MSDAVDFAKLLMLENGGSQVLFFIIGILLAGGSFSYLFNKLVPHIVSESMKIFADEQKELREQQEKQHNLKMEVIEKAATTISEKMYDLGRCVERITYKLDTATDKLNEATQTAAHNFRQIESSLVFTNNQIQGIDSSVDTLTSAVMKQEVLMGKIILHVDKD